MSYQVDNLIGKALTHPSNINIISFDIETDSLDPYSADAKVVLIGFYDGVHYYIYDNPMDAFSFMAKSRRPDTVFVGHNTKFDLKYLLAQHPDRTHIISECDYACTQLAEYMLSGHHAKMASLDDVAEKYVGAIKESTVSSMIKSGVKCSDIDRESLVAYLKQDLLLTRKVFERQVNRYFVGWDKLWSNYRIQCDAMLGYAMLEANGIKFDRDGLVRAHLTVEQEIVNNEKAMQEVLKNLGFPLEHLASVNLTSNATVSTILYATPGIKYRDSVEVGTYKNGKPKKKMTEFTWAPPIVSSIENLNPEEKAHGCYDVSDGTLDKGQAFLQKVLAANPTNKVVELVNRYVQLVRDTRLLSKVDGTYFVPLIDKLDSTTHTDKIHPSINQCVTATGRTSSSGPNCQNLPPVVTAFAHPSEEAGVFLDSDFKQLEVCGLAQMTMDGQLIADLKSGADIHFLTGKDVMGWRTPKDMDKKSRRLVKGVNFGIIYGGGAPTIAAQTGAPVDLVKKLIKSFYARYPGVRQWQADMIDLVNREGSVGEDSPVVGNTHAQISYYDSPTGRRYRFVQSLVPENYARVKGEMNFKPTEIKNYPIQGFSTGDIVPMLVALLAKTVPQYRLVAVVHDSLLHDCYTKQQAEELRNLMDDLVSQGIPDILERVFNIVPLVPLSLDHATKTSW